MPPWINVPGDGSSTEALIRYTPEAPETRPEAASTLPTSKVEFLDTGILSIKPGLDIDLRSASLDTDNVQRAT